MYVYIPVYYVVITYNASIYIDIRYTTNVYRYHQPVVYMSSTPVHVDLLSFTYQRQIRQTGGTYVCMYVPLWVCKCVCTINVLCTIVHVCMYNTLVSSIYVTGPAKINHVSANYTELYFR